MTKNIKQNQINISVDDIETEKEVINIDDLMKEVDKKCFLIENDNCMDNYIALEMEYNINYKMDQLKHIMKYYELSTRKKKKADFVEDIVIFEMDPENIGIVSRRKYLWECIANIQNDSYLRNFLNIST